MSTPLPQGMPAYWPAAIADLSESDATLAGLIATFPGVSLQARGAPFITLVRSIVGQQISVKAADSVWARLLAAFPGPTPEGLMVADVAALRACGLSARKVEYLQDLAGRWLDGRLHATAWEQMSDAEAEAAIKAVIKAVNASSMKDMGAVMAQLRAEYAGQMDFGKASGIIKSLL